MSDSFFRTTSGSSKSSSKHSSEGSMESRMNVKAWTPWAASFLLQLCINLLILETVYHVHFTSHNRPSGLALWCENLNSWVTIDEIMCWLLRAIVDHEMMVSVIRAWGIWWTGLPHSPKTNGNHLIKDNLGRYCLKTFETAKGKEEGDTAGNQIIID